MNTRHIKKPISSLFNINLIDFNYLPIKNYNEKLFFSKKFLKIEQNNLVKKEKQKLSISPLNSTKTVLKFVNNYSLTDFFRKKYLFDSILNDDKSKSFVYETFDLPSNFKDLQKQKNLKQKLVKSLLFPKLQSWSNFYKKKIVQKKSKRWKKWKTKKIIKLKWNESKYFKKPIDPYFKSIINNFKMFLPKYHVGINSSYFIANVIRAKTPFFVNNRIYNLYSITRFLKKSSKCLFLINNIYRKKPFFFIFNQRFLFQKRYFLAYKQQKNLIKYYQAKHQEDNLEIKLINCLKMLKNNTSQQKKVLQLILKGYLQSQKNIYSHFSNYAKEK